MNSYRDELFTPEAPVPSPGFLEDFKVMPSLHKALIGVALLFMLVQFIESIFLLPYLLVRWGWGYSVG